MDVCSGVVCPENLRFWGFWVFGGSEGVLKPGFHFLSTQFPLFFPRFFQFFLFLPPVKCTLDQIKCYSGNQCLARIFMCDGMYDCADGSDERKCGEKKCNQ